MHCQFHFRAAERDDVTMEGIRERVRQVIGESRALRPAVSHRRPVSHEAGGCHLVPVLCEGAELAARTKLHRSHGPLAPLLHSRGLSSNCLSGVQRNAVKMIKVPGRKCTSVLGENRGTLAT